MFPFLMFNLNFFSIGCAVNHHRQLFKCKGMATQADTKHQSRFFAADFRNQRLGILQKFSTDCLAYCLIGLPSYKARKKA